MPWGQEGGKGGEEGGGAGGVRPWGIESEREEGGKRGSTRKGGADRRSCANVKLRDD